MHSTTVLELLCQQTGRRPKMMSHISGTDLHVTTSCLYYSFAPAWPLEHLG